jgi:hypothetical protein
MFVKRAAAMNASSPAGDLLDLDRDTPGFAERGDQLTVRDVHAEVPAGGPSMFDRRQAWRGNQ